MAWILALYQNLSAITEENKKQKQANLPHDRYSSHTLANTSEVQSSFSCTKLLNTLRTGDADLRF